MEKQVDQKQLATLKKLATTKSGLELPSVYIIRPGIKLGVAKDLLPASEENVQIGFNLGAIDATQAQGVSIDQMTFAIHGGDQPLSKIEINPHLQRMGELELRMPAVRATVQHTLGRMRIANVWTGVETHPFEDIASLIHRHKTRVRNQIVVLKTQQDYSKQQLAKLDHLDINSRQIVVADLKLQVEQMEKSLKRHREDLAISGEIFKEIQAKIQKTSEKKKSGK